MRISDWSSDGCSSDLAGLGSCRARLAGAGGRGNACQPLRGIEGPEKTLAATETEIPATPFHPPGGTSCPARATNPFWSNHMAVQKSRVSPSRRGQRSDHDSLTANQLSTAPTPGATHTRHHVPAPRYSPPNQATHPD